MEKERGHFGSNFGFLMAAIGSAVGLGNLWGFPYKMGANGGFAFLIIYLALVLLCGVIIMTIEMAIGRKTGKSPVYALATFGKRWRPVGWFGVGASFIIMGFYTVICGWVLRYVVDYFMTLIGQGTITSVDGVTYFTSAFGDITLNLIYTLLAFVITCVIVMGGIQKGIEKFSKVAMPALFVMLIVVIIKGLTMEGSAEGLEFMFTFKSEDFNFFNALRTAGGQMMFSLSLGMGALITYGSYMTKDSNISKNGWIIPIADTIMALLSGLAIFPALFALDMDPSGGPGLLFMTLHNVFDSMGAVGPIFGFVFYVLTLIAALSSMISLVEVSTSHFYDYQASKGKTPSRKKITFWVCLGMFIISLPIIFDKLGESGIFSWVPIKDKDGLDFYDFIASGVLMPLGGVFLSALIGWRKGGMAYLDDEIRVHDNKFVARGFFNVVVKITPAIMIVVLFSLLLSYFGL